MKRAFVGIALALGTAAVTTAVASAVAGPSAAVKSLASASASRPSDRFADIDWLTPKRGWALVDRACGSGSSGCLAIYGTRDGGRSWQRLTPQNDFGCSRVGRCVTGLRFVTSRIGYLYGPRSFRTTDGGRRCERLTLPDVESVAVSGDLVYELVYAHSGCPGPWRPALIVLSPRSLRARQIHRWRLGPGFGEQLVAGGGNLYVIFFGHLAGGEPSAHAAIAFSRDRGRTWTERHDPCGGSGSNERDAVAIAAAHNFVAVLCVSRRPGGPAFTELSRDAGRTFTAGARPHLGAPEQIAVGDRGLIAVGNGGMTGAGGFQYELVLSHDGGRTWRVAVRDREPLLPQVERTPLQFVGARTLSWVGDPHVVWRSSDTGQTWRKTAAP